MTQLQVQITSEVTRRIRHHARTHMTVEVCGVLIGRMMENTLFIVAMIEALNAAQGGTHVTFTQDAWEMIYREKDERYPEERIVGWYHSHPGFGVFLSDHDTFIHQNFFSSPSQVAWVYDPHMDEEGCFAWNNGAIQRLSEFTILDLDDNTEHAERKEDGAPVWVDEESESNRLAAPSQRSAPIPAWLRLGVRGISYLVVLLLGFLIAYTLFPRLVGIPVDPATGEPLFELKPPATAPPLKTIPQQGGNTKSGAGSKR